MRTRHKCRVSEVRWRIFRARRPDRKARGARISGIYKRRATPRGGMPRPENDNELLRQDTSTQRILGDLIAVMADCAMVLVCLGGEGLLQAGTVDGLPPLVDLADLACIEN